MLKFVSKRIHTCVPKSRFYSDIPKKHTESLISLYKDKNVSVLKDSKTGEVFTKRGISVAVITFDQHENVILFKKTFPIQQAAGREDPLVSLQLPRIYIPAPPTTAVASTTKKNSDAEKDPSGLIQELIINGTGFIPDEIQPMSEIYSSPEVSSDVTYVYTARKLRISPKTDEELKKFQSENNFLPEVWNPRRLYEELQKGSSGDYLFNDSVTVAALSQLLMHRQSELESRRSRTIYLMIFFVGALFGTVCSMLMYNNQDLLIGTNSEEDEDAHFRQFIDRVSQEYQEDLADNVVPQTTDGSQHSK
ncbi:jac1 [Acrasis kona]|uniref:Jac1 n=1 Tax=Acrasis kona TaxID=1008807 RepID=A0AAW2YMT6_9EUKA